MLRSKSSTLGIKSISDLANVYKGGKTLGIGVNAEFSQRPDGLPGVQKTYGFTVPLDSIVKMDFGLSFQALRDGQVDSAMVTSTDGRIISFDILVLADDKNFFPIYLMTPVARKEVLDKNPKLGRPCWNRSRQSSTATRFSSSTPPSTSTRNRSNPSPATS